MVLTANARGLLHAHPLGVPASPSLKAVRALMDDADLVIAVGTEFGPTDYDMYGDGGFVMPKTLVRIDIDAEQLDAAAGDGLDPGRLRRGAVRADRGAARPRAAADDGAARAEATRSAACAELGARHAGADRRGRGDPRRLARLDHRRRFDAAGLCRQPLLRPRPAGRLVQCGDRLRRARLRPAGGDRRGARGTRCAGRLPDRRRRLPVHLPELGAAVDAGAPVIFVVWNNRGYREIETSMLDAGVEPVGVSPAPPDFLKIAEAYGIAAERISAVGELAAALKRAREAGRPYLVEITVA